MGHPAFLLTVEMVIKIIDILFFILLLHFGLLQRSVDEGFHLLSIEFQAGVLLLDVPHICGPLLKIIRMNSNADTILNSFSGSLAGVFVV